MTTVLNPRPKLGAKGLRFRYCCSGLTFFFFLLLCVQYDFHYVSSIYLNESHFLPRLQTDFIFELLPAQALCVSGIHQVRKPKWPNFSNPADPNSIFTLPFSSLRANSQRSAHRSEFL
jgi:hypothetical protein